MTLYQRVLLLIFPTLLAGAAPKKEMEKTLLRPLPADTTVCPMDDLSIRGKCHVGAAAEFLYWKPTEGGTEFAFTTRTTAPIPGKTSPSYVPFGWKPGFRIGVNYFLPDPGWSLSFAAADFSASELKHVNGVLFPLQAAQSSLQNTAESFSWASSAAVHWKLKDWIFDLRCGRELSFCKNFMFKPYAGLKGALIHQHFHYTYGNVVEVDPPVRNYSIFIRNNCNSIGIQGGIHGEWPLGKGVRLLGDCSQALVYGWFHIDDNQSGQVGVSDAIAFSSKVQRLIPATDLFLGVSWGTFFSCHSKHVEFHAGYEAQYWWRQNLAPRFMSTQSPYYLLISEDLGLQGLTLGGSVDF